MQEGNAALARRDYRTAEQAAREVLTGSRTSPRAYDAQYLLAQALLGQRQFPQAAIAYDDTYNRARTGAHAQDAMLGLANSLLAINERHAACDTLVKLRNEFPSPRADLRDGIAEVDAACGVQVTTADHHPLGFCRCHGLARAVRGCTPSGGGRFGWP